MNPRRHLSHNLTAGKLNPGPFPLDFPPTGRQALGVRVNSTMAFFCSFAPHQTVQGLRLEKVQVLLIITQFGFKSVVFCDILRIEITLID